MKNQILFAAALIGMICCLTGCPSPNSSNGTNENNGGDNKITSLSAVITNAKDGDTIDLSQSQYADITDYSATVSKSVTITNGDLGSASLTVTAAGVTLQNVTGSASVTTSASMKISGSSLANLTVDVAARGSSDIIIRISNVQIKTLLKIVSTVKIILEKTTTAKVEVAATAADTRLTLRGAENSITSCDIQTKTEVKLEGGATAPAAITSAEKAEVKQTPTTEISGVYEYTLESGNLDNGEVSYTELQQSDGVYSAEIKPDEKWLAASFDCSSDQHCGIISFDIKTDKAVGVTALAVTAIGGDGNGVNVTTKADTWQTVTVETGYYPQGFTKAVLEIWTDPAIVSIRNAVYTPIDDDTAQRLIVRRYTAYSGSDVTITESGNVVLKTTTKPENKDHGDDVGICPPITLQTGQFYKVIYTVTATKTTDRFTGSANVNSAESRMNTNWAWISRKRHLDAGVPTKIVGYVASIDGCYYQSSNKYQMLDADKTRTPLLWVWFGCEDENVITVSDIKAESITWDAITKEMNVAYQVGDDIYIEPPTFGIPASGFKKFRMIIYSKNNEQWWDPVNVNATIESSHNYLVYDKQIEGLTFSMYPYDDVMLIQNPTRSRIVVKAELDPTTLKVKLTEGTESETAWSYDENLGWNYEIDNQEITTVSDFTSTGDSVSCSVEFKKWDDMRIVKNIPTTVINKKYKISFTYNNTEHPIIFVSGRFDGGMPVGFDYIYDGNYWIYNSDENQINQIMIHPGTTDVYPDDFLLSITNFKVEQLSGDAESLVGDSSFILELQDIPNKAKAVALFCNVNWFEPALINGSDYWIVDVVDGKATWSLTNINFNREFLFQLVPMADKNTELVNDDNMEIAWWGYGISGSGDYWANANNIAISFANNDIENGNKVIITKKLNSWDSDGTWDDETFPVYQQSGQRQWGEEYRNCFTVEK